MATWKDVVGYEGWYEVSDEGLVRRTRPGHGTWVGRELRPVTNSRGYWAVVLTKDAAMRHQMVHNLVLESFVGPKPEGHEPDHINRDRKDNRLENLRWVPRHTNRSDVDRSGRPLGEQKTGHKLTEQDVLDIRASDHTLRSLADRYGVHHTTVLAIKRREKWGHV